MISHFGTLRQRANRKTSAHPRWISHRVIGALTALCLSLAMLSADLYAGSAVITDKHIRARLALMRGQKAALLTLSDMTTGRSTFTPQRARAARRVLIENTRKIPKRFAKQRLESNSHARPEIWARWQDFETRAEAARQAAKQINTNSISGLRRSLPTMMQACHSCHQTYRTMPNRAITH